MNKVRILFLKSECSDQVSSSRALKKTSSKITKIDWSSSLKSLLHSARQDTTDRESKRSDKDNIINIFWITAAQSRLSVYQTRLAVWKSLLLLLLLFFFLTFCESWICPKEEILDPGSFRKKMVEFCSSYKSVVLLSVNAKPSAKRRVILSYFFRDDNLLNNNVYFLFFFSFFFHSNRRRARIDDYFAFQLGNSCSRERKEKRKRVVIWLSCKWHAIKYVDTRSIFMNKQTDEYVTFNLHSLAS